MIKLKVMLASLLFLLILVLSDMERWWLQPEEKRLIRKETTIASSVYLRSVHRDSKAFGAKEIRKEISDTEKAIGKSPGVSTLLTPVLWYGE